MAFFGEGFVIVLDFTKIVEVVDHYTVRLGESFGRSIAKVIQPLQLCAVAKMEARHRIDRLALGGTGGEQVCCRCRD